MSQAFKDRTNFDENITGWDASSVTTMKAMFSGATLFNQFIGNWDVSSVTDMEGMFYQANAFNQDVGNWDVSSVTNLWSTFNMLELSTNLSNWNTSAVTDARQAFFNASDFNQDLSSWDVSVMNITVQMFNGTSALSNSNKGLIHKKFSTNANWYHDWSGIRDLRTDHKCQLSGCGEFVVLPRSQCHLHIRPHQRLEYFRGNGYV